MQAVIRELEDRGGPGLPRWYAYGFESRRLTGLVFGCRDRREVRRWAEAHRPALLCDREKPRRPIVEIVG